MSKQLARRPYPSDVTDAQWELLAPLIPEPGTWSPREPIARREIVTGILYLLRTGCCWRQMPHDLPNGKTVYHYFRKWTLDGTWEQAMSALRQQVRTRMGRDEEPSAAIIDTDVYKSSRAKKYLPIFCLSIRLEDFKPRMLTYVKTKPYGLLRCASQVLT